MRTRSIGAQRNEHEHADWIRKHKKSAMAKTYPSQKAREIFFYLDENERTRSVQKPEKGMKQKKGQIQS
jgi:hypothetical protein